MSFISKVKALNQVGFKTHLLFRYIHILVTHVANWKAVA